MMVQTYQAPTVAITSKYTMKLERFDEIWSVSKEIGTCGKRHVENKILEMVFQLLAEKPIIATFRIAHTYIVFKMKGLRMCMVQWIDRR